MEASSAAFSRWLRRSLASKQRFMPLKRTARRSRWPRKGGSPPLAIRTRSLSSRRPATSSPSSLRTSPPQRSRLARHTSVRPTVRAAEIAQDRMSEKHFLSGIGLPTAAYSPLEGEDDIPAAASLLAQAGTGILKIAREGYDGKGQARVSSEAELRSAFLRFAAPCVLEALVRFSMEISVIAVRSAGGDVLFYNCPENTHAGGILRKSAVPASCPEHQQSVAQAITARIAAKLDYCGVMGVEFFVMPQDSAQPLLVNEIAPRVHNSGHSTMEACAISQFENHIALSHAGRSDRSRVTRTRSYKSHRRRGARWRSILEKDPGASLYLYGKSAIREGRKLGHVTQISPLKKNEDNPYP